MYQIIPDTMKCSETCRCGMRWAGSCEVKGLIYSIEQLYIGKFMRVMKMLDITDEIDVDPYLIYREMDRSD